MLIAAGSPQPEDSSVGRAGTSRRYADRVLTRCHETVFPTKRAIIRPEFTRAGSRIPNGSHRAGDEAGTAAAGFGQRIVQATEMKTANPADRPGSSRIGYFHRRREYPVNRSPDTSTRPLEEGGCGQALAHEWSKWCRRTLHHPATGSEAVINRLSVAHLAAVVSPT